MQLAHRGKTIEIPPIFPNRAIREFYGGSVGPLINPPLLKSQNVEKGGVKDQDPR